VTGAIFADASAIVGVFSYNTLIPAAPGSAGVDDFEIDNLTGPFTIAPDFPIANPLTLQNSTVVLTRQGGSQQTFVLGDLVAGIYTPISLQISSLTGVTSALFTATLNQTSLTLIGGVPVQATSSAISVDLLPASSPSLVPDSDFALISIDTQTTAIPEPSLGGLELGVGFAALYLLKLQRSRQ